MQLKEKFTNKSKNLDQDLERYSIITEQNLQRTAKEKIAQHPSSFKFSEIKLGDLKEFSSNRESFFNEFLQKNTEEMSKTFNALHQLVSESGNQVKVKQDNSTDIDLLAKYFNKNSEQVIAAMNDKATSYDGNEYKKYAKQLMDEISSIIDFKKHESTTSKGKNLVANKKNRSRSHSSSITIGR
ncbi:MAG: hypothetical protein AB8B67_04190 [Rickettsiaceae bacterium]